MMTNGIIISYSRAICIAALVALESCGAAYFVKATSSNEEMRQCYTKMCEDVFYGLASTLPSAKLEARDELDAIATIRNENVRSLLLENLGYSRHVSNGSATNNTDFYWGMVVDSGTLFKEGKFPAYYALTRIGLSSDDWREIATLYPENFNRNYVLAMLGRMAFGPYFNHYLQGKIACGATNYVGISKVILPYPPERARRLNVYSALIGKAYENMETILRGRFRGEMSSSSSNLVDTISTMGFIRSETAIAVLADNLTICPQVSTNAPDGFVFPAAEALIAIGPAIGDCFARLKAAKPLSVEETLWLRISHELYPEGLEYELYCAAQTNDLRAARLMQSLPWRRLTEEDMKDP